MVELQGKKMGQSLLLSVVTSGQLPHHGGLQGAQKECTTHCRCGYSMDVSGSSDEQDYMHVGKDA